MRVRRDSCSAPWAAAGPDRQLAEAEFRPPGSFPLIARFGPPDRRKLSPVRRRREAACKCLIYMELSRMTGPNLGAESMIRPVLPGFTGVAGDRRPRRLAPRSLLVALEVAKTDGRRMRGAHGGIVFSDPRRVAARRNIDLDRHSVATRSAQHVSAGRLADSAGCAADGRPGVHDALHSGARRQDRDRTRSGTAAGDGGVPAGSRARRRGRRRARARVSAASGTARRDRRGASC